MTPERASCTQATKPSARARRQLIVASYSSSEGDGEGGNSSKGDGDEGPVTAMAIAGECGWAKREEAAIRLAAREAEEQVKREAAATRKRVSSKQRPCRQRRMASRAARAEDQAMWVREEEGWEAALVELARIVASEAARVADTEVCEGPSEGARAAGRQVEVNFSRWESEEAGMARAAAARAAGQVAAAEGGRLAARAEAAHAAARAVEQFRRRRVEVAQAVAVRGEELEAEVEAGRACTQRRRVIAMAEANLRPARREWQKDQAAGGLEGWGIGGERSEEERLWRWSRG